MEHKYVKECLTIFGCDLILKMRVKFVMRRCFVYLSKCFLNAPLVLFPHLLRFYVNVLLDSFRSAYTNNLYFLVDIYMLTSIDLFAFT